LLCIQVASSSTPLSGEDEECHGGVCVACQAPSSYSCTSRLQAYCIVTSSYNTCTQDTTQPQAGIVCSFISPGYDHQCVLVWVICTDSMHRLSRCIEQRRWCAGIPFRETHHISGAAVKLAEDKGCQLSDLTTQDLQGINKLFEDDVQEVWDFDRYAMS